MTFYPAGGGGSAPVSPWQFMPGSYGGKGDGKVVTDGAMSGTATLTCATSAPFTSADVGKYIHVGGAGGGTYTPLCTTIASYISSSQVTLTTAATSSVTSAIVVWATDDTFAINSAVSAAVTYAQAHNGYAEVVFQPVIYGIGGACVTGGTTFGNAQIPLPVIADTAEKVTLVFKGTLDASALPHWLQTTPQCAGTFLACLRNDGTGGSNGQSCVIGGPYLGYGESASNPWNNMLVTLDGVAALLPYNGSYAGFDFWGQAEANVKTAAVMAMAVVPSGSSVPSMGTPSNLSNFGPFGLRMPSAYNNDNCNVDWFSCEGMIQGLWVSEHSVVESMRLINCRNALIPYCGSGNPNHYTKIVRGSIENCQYAVVSAADGANRLIAYLDMETINVEIVNDSSATITGLLEFTGVAGAVAASFFSGAGNMNIINLQQPTGLWSGAPAAPSSTATQQNTAWRPALIYWQVAGGSVSAIDVDGTLLNGTPNPVAVPSGHTWSPTYTGTLSTQWVLS